MCQAMASMGFAYMDLPAFLAARSTLNIILSWSSPDRALGRRLALVRPHIIGGNAQRFHKTGEFPWRHGIPHILAEECWGKWSWYPSSWKSGGKPIVWPPTKITWPWHGKETYELWLSAINTFPPDSPNLNHPIQNIGLGGSPQILNFQNHWTHQCQPHLPSLSQPNLPIIFWVS